MLVSYFTGYIVIPIVSMAKIIVLSQKIKNKINFLDILTFQGFLNIWAYFRKYRCMRVLVCVCGIVDTIIRPRF